MAAHARASAVRIAPFRRLADGLPRKEVEADLSAFRRGLDSSVFMLAGRPILAAGSFAKSRFARRVVGNCGGLYFAISSAFKLIYSTT